MKDERDDVRENGNDGEDRKGSTYQQPFASDEY